MLIHDETPVTDDVLDIVAHLPTPSIARLISPGFFAKWTDAERMRLAVRLAWKSYQEGGCPIGGVVIDNHTHQIVGKGHNTLVQTGDPYNHGETAAIRDAGRIDFSRTTLLTTLSPCLVCAALIMMRGFPRVIVGDVTNANGTEVQLRNYGVQVEILEDRDGVDLYARYRAERPELDLEDWRGRAALRET